MSRILIAYSSVDGHTRAICERLQSHLAGHAVTLQPLAQGPALDAGRFDHVVIGASIRYGKHRPEVYEFIARNLAWLRRHPSAFFSVNVVARKPGKDTAQTNPYVQDFLRLTPWRPALLGVFAGKIDYARYGYAERQVIRFIMLLTHGPTDPRACVDFTDWNAVAAFAQAVARLPDARAVTPGAAPSAARA